jgi:AAA+ ATPase superfamily predicted ATPase
MPFIDRTDDLRDLSTRWGQGPQSYLLWGRRRVGKSALIHQFAAGKDAIIYQAIRGTVTDQLSLLTGRILAWQEDPVLQAAPLANWEQAFAYLESLAQRRRAAGDPLLLVFDELQYLADADESLLTRLQDFLDRVKQRNLPLFTILAGSSISFFEGRVAIGSLFGRRTGGGLLAPLDYLGAVQFFPQWHAADRIRAWALLGGMPYYLEQFDPNRSLTWNARERMLRRNQVLYNEAELLLAEELHDAPQYLSVLAALAGGATRLSEISGWTKIPVTSLPAILGRLGRLHLVERSRPVGEGADSKRGLWTLLDNYLRFWFTFIRPNQVELEAGRADAIWRTKVAPELDHFVSKPAFEMLCRAWVRTHLGFHPSLPAGGEVGGWWGASVEVTPEGRRSVQREADIAVRDPSGRIDLVGEAKWTSGPVDNDALTQLRAAARAIPGVTDETRLVLFGRGSFTDRVHAAADAEGILLLGADDLLGS